MLVGNDLLGSIDWGELCGTVIEHGKLRSKEKNPSNPNLTKKYTSKLFEKKVRSRRGNKNTVHYV